MKGITGLLFVVIVSILTVIGLFILYTHFNIEGVRRSIVERGIIAEINKMEFLKTNLHQALDYSFYQAKYEVAALGGYVKLAQPAYNNLPYWRVYTATYDPPYLKNLEDRTLALYNIYNKAIKTEISKPEATKVTIEKISNTDYALVIALTTEPMRLEKPNLVIEENGTVNETIRTKILEMFDIGKNNFVATDKIKESIVNAINSLNLPSTGEKTGCGYCPSAEEVFIHVSGSSFSQAEKLMKEAIDDYLNKLEEKLSTDGIQVSFLNREIKTKVDYSCQSSWGGCCEMECDDYGNCWCVEWSCTTTCDFDFYGAARALVNITDKTSLYAVYDKTTDLRNIMLKFYVVAGNKELI